jgi:hypothetical protein
MENHLIDPKDYKMIIWGNTAKGAKVYPLTRTDEELVNAKFEYHLNKVMHRPGELNTDY